MGRPKPRKRYELEEKRPVALLLPEYLARRLKAISILIGISRSELVAELLDEATLRWEKPLRDAVGKMSLYPKRPGG
jgi:hypothetical protein